MFVGWIPQLDFMTRYALRRFQWTADPSRSVQKILVSTQICVLDLGQALDVSVRALPQHFKTLIDRFCLDGQAFVEMDNMRLITTTYRIVAQKPTAPAPPPQAPAAAA